jgi:hypothetical protein
VPTLAASARAARCFATEETVNPKELHALILRHRIVYDNEAGLQDSLEKIGMSGLVKRLEIEQKEPVS